eukprot:2454140-Pyramimonas_sp.AAC.1
MAGEVDSQSEATNSQSEAANLPSQGSIAISTQSVEFRSEPRNTRGSFEAVAMLRAGKRMLRAGMR